MVNSKSKQLVSQNLHVGQSSVVKSCFIPARSWKQTLSRGFTLCTLSISLLICLATFSYAVLRTHSDFVQIILILLSTDPKAQKQVKLKFLSISSNQQVLAASNLIMGTRDKIQCRQMERGRGEHPHNSPHRVFCNYPRYYYSLLYLIC